MGIATEIKTPPRRRREVARPLFVDAQELAGELRLAIRGEVRFDRGSRALYATDGSNYRQVPIGVVIPRDVDEVVRTIAICRGHGAPILSRGGGTSLTGGCCNVAVVIDWSKHLNKVLAIDPEKKLARVQPGTVLDILRTQAERHHLTFAPDPSTHTHNTLGGMIGNNSCGVHSLMGLGTGRTSDQVHELEILLYDGTRMTVGTTSDEELEQMIRAGGRKERFTPSSSRCGTVTPMRSAVDTPRTCRVGFLATTSMTCCPKEAFMWPGHSPAPKGRA